MDAWTKSWISFQYRWCLVFATLAGASAGAGLYFGQEYGTFWYFIWAAIVAVNAWWSFDCFSTARELELLREDIKYPE